MASRAKDEQGRPGDLPTERILRSDGTFVEKKAVQADSPTFAQDMLAAFRWNVQRIREDQRRRGIGEDVAEG